MVLYILYAMYTWSQEKIPTKTSSYCTFYHKMGVFETDSNTSPRMRHIRCYKEGHKIGRADEWSGGSTQAIASSIKFRGMVVIVIKAASRPGCYGTWLCTTSRKWNSVQYSTFRTSGSELLFSKRNNTVPHSQHSYEDTTDRRPCQICRSTQGWHYTDTLSPFIWSLV